MKYDNLIRDLLESFDWDKIRTIHRLLKLTWKEKDKHGNVYEFLPSQEELKQELFLILRFAIFKNLGIIESGQWLVMWREETEDATARLEAYFIVEEGRAEQPAINLDIEMLEKKLSDAIKEEKYEDAVKFRDKINAIKNA